MLTVEFSCHSEDYHGDRTFWGVGRIHAWLVLQFVEIDDSRVVLLAKQRPNRSSCKRVSRTLDLKPSIAKVVHYFSNTPFLR